MKHAMLLADVEREKLPYTWNEIFNSNLQTSRGRWIAPALAPKARRETSKNFGTSKIVVDFNIIETAVKAIHTQQSECVPNAGLRHNLDSVLPAISRKHQLPVMSRDQEQRQQNDVSLLLGAGRSHPFMPGRNPHTQLHAAPPRRQPPPSSRR
jgi:hypothetical protein